MSGGSSDCLRVLRHRQQRRSRPRFSHASRKLGRHGQHSCWIEYKLGHCAGETAVGAAKTVPQLAASPTDSCSGRRALSWHRGSGQPPMWRSRGGRGSWLLWSPLQGPHGLNLPYGGCDAAASWDLQLDLQVPWAHSAGSSCSPPPLPERAATTRRSVGEAGTVCAEEGRRSASCVSHA